MLVKCILETKPCTLVESSMALVWSFLWSPVLLQAFFCPLPRLSEQKGKVRLLFPFYKDSELDVAEQNIPMHIQTKSNNCINADAVFHSYHAYKNPWSSVFQGVFFLELQSRRWDKNLPKLYFMK